MKRYKQAILSNFFVAQIIKPCGSQFTHLVEANLDIESRADRTLCTEVLHGAYRYEVLTNHLLPDVCPICSAILDRRISNMPKDRKITSGFPDEICSEVPESQMDLLSGMSAERTEAKVEEAKQGHQFDLF
ncbi:hypothetical protein [Endozoicomonas arenosclerae]|uniref:hypothetical protein n=1 Tax=Endozoicomonas arenosclerae TaxID=1633495 RepID=UPI0012947E3D|nr:hypothetical protein [Endozoicomonas arenosclerae]